jgi:hypothetical protein
VGGVIGESTVFQVLFLCFFAADSLAVLQTSCVGLTLSWWQFDRCLNGVRPRLAGRLSRRVERTIGELRYIFSPPSGCLSNGAKDADG